MPRVAHALTAMTGRDSHEHGRTATTLELLFDLTFVVVFSIASVQGAHFLAEGHYKAAVIGYLFVSGAAVWAWINFTWMASAFDTDDWLFRLVTMLQMVGVCILALGVEPVFSSIDGSGHLDNGIVVLGYVVMRVALLFQWIRVALSSAEYRPTAIIYIASITVAQVGWILTAVVDITLTQMIVAAAVLWCVELAGPVLAERRAATPWHPHHIAERYGLLVIITLGEGIVGTVTVLGAIVAEQGWTLDAAVFGIAGIAINFCLWWMYFAIPMAESLEEQPQKSFPWGYGHMPVFIAIAAFGAGLHVAALQIEHETHIEPTVVVASIAAPLAVFYIGLYLIYGYLVRFRPSILAVFAGALGILVAAVVMAALGASVVWSIGVAALSSVVIVLFDEFVEAKRR